MRCWQEKLDQISSTNLFRFYDCLIEKFKVDLKLLWRTPMINTHARLYTIDFLMAVAVALLNNFIKGTQEHVRAQ